MGGGERYVGRAQGWGRGFAVRNEKTGREGLASLMKSN